MSIINHVISVSLYFRSKNANGDDICLPCHCFSDGSVDNFCDATTGQCKCNKGVHGDKCDACSHQFAELTSKGCQPIYGSCPAQYNKNILWPRTEFGQVVNANCSSGAVGIAVRRCTNSTSGWAEPDLSGCLHKEFLVFRNILLPQNVLSLFCDHNNNNFVVTGKFYIFINFKTDLPGHILTKFCTLAIEVKNR